MQVLRCGIIQDRARGEDKAAVLRHIVKQLLDVVLNILRSSCFQHRNGHVTAEASPATESLLHFLHVGLIEYPERRALGDVRIGDDVQPLVVATFDEQVRDDPKSA